MADVQKDSAETQRLLEAANSGDEAALAQLLQRHEAHLYSFINLRLDPQLRSRLDPSDIIQETHLEVFKRFQNFLQRRPMPFRLWLRKTAYQRLLMFHREHVHAEKRSIKREQALLDRSSQAWAEQFVDSLLSPSKDLQRQEQIAQMKKALLQLNKNNRDLLLMRHYEQLSYEEIALILDLKPATVRQRHGRALIQLNSILSAMNLLEED